MSWPKSRPQSRRDRTRSGTPERSNGHREAQPRSHDRFATSDGNNNVLNSGDSHHYWGASGSPPQQPRTPPGRPPSSSPLLRRSPSPDHYYDFDYFMRMSNRIHDDFRDEHDRGLSPTVPLFVSNLSRN